MKKLKTVIEHAKHIYLVNVKYNKDHFYNKKKSLLYTYKFASTEKRNLDYIEKIYKNCKVLSIEKIK